VLGIFERANPHREPKSSVESLKSDSKLIIILGLGSYGIAISKGLREYNWNLLGVDFDPKALADAEAMNMPVLYGDAADPEIFDQLPVDKASWVLCTIGDHKINLSLLRFLQEKQFDGRIALAADKAEYVHEYRKKGANLVLYPFDDASEQAVEALNCTIESIPQLRDWPVAIEEASLQPGSVFTGKTLRELNIRGKLGVSVIAISRAGKINFNPGPEFRMYPGDRIVLLCPPERASKAVGYLLQRDLGAPQDQGKTFDAEEILVSAESPWSGRSLAELDFPHHFGVTVIGIRRGRERIISPLACDTLEPDDRVVVVGSSENLAQIIKAAQ
jgi:Trk K+ transport system NAD-binding subunit